MIPRWTPVRRALVLLAMAAIAVLPATAGATVFPETIRLPDGFQPEGETSVVSGRRSPVSPHSGMRTPYFATVRRCACLSPKGRAAACAVRIRGFGPSRTSVVQGTAPETAADGV